MKTFQILFSLFALKKISQVHQVRRNDPSSITFTFSQLWGNSSQLARLFKVKVALSPDLNTARWFARMDFPASVHKQGRLSASAVNRELAMPWKWTIRVVTIWDFHGMIMVSENITVSRYTVLNNQNSYFFWLNKCLEACVYSNFINQKQSSKFHQWLYISLTTYIHQVKP